MTIFLTMKQQELYCLLKWEGPKNSLSGMLLKQTNKQTIYIGKEGYSKMTEISIYSSNSH